MKRNVNKKDIDPNAVSLKVGELINSYFKQILVTKI